MLPTVTTTVPVVVGAPAPDGSAPFTSADKLSVTPELSLEPEACSAVSPAGSSVAGAGSPSAGTALAA